MWRWRPLWPLSFQEVFWGAPRESGISAKNGRIGYPWSSFCLPKYQPCSWPRIRVLILVAYSDLHRNRLGEFPFTHRNEPGLSFQVWSFGPLSFSLESSSPPPPPPPPPPQLSFSLSKYYTHLFIIIII